MDCMLVELLSKDGASASSPLSSSSLELQATRNGRFPAVLGCFDDPSPLSSSSLELQAARNGRFPALVGSDEEVPAGLDSNL